MESMLQRTQARQVAPVFKAFATKFPTVEKLQEASDGDLEAAFAPLGLKWRIARLVELCRTLARAGGDVPASQPELQRFPGIGPYASAAYLSLHAGTRAAIVDSNVVRVICRILGSEYGPETRRQPWLLRIADQLTPSDRFREFGYAMLDLGIEVCRPKPKCDVCPVADLCNFNRGHQPSKRARESSGRTATLQASRASSDNR